MKRIIKGIGIGLLVLVMFVCVFLLWLTHRDNSLKENYREQIQTGGELEQHYLQDGPYETAYYEEPTMQVFEKYEISYPQELETEDKKYPVIVVCNGTGWKGSLNRAQYQFYASYGFSVIATEETYSWNGFGAEMCMRHLERLNSYVSDEGEKSIFYQKIDFDHVGIIGHSQGGVGVINAITNTDHKEIYKAAVALSPTNEEMAAALEWPYDAAKIQVPVFVISGEGGGDDWVITFEQLNQLYSHIPTDKVMARRVNTPHGTTVVSEDGYVMAWFLWHLQGEQEAAGVFVGETAELLHNQQYQDVRISLSDGQMVGIVN